jgi:hypothetical protein
MNSYFVERNHIVKGLAPHADLYNGDPATDVVNMKNYERCTFILHQNATTVSSNGTAVITVEACTSAAGSSATAIAFKYTKLTTGVSDASTALTSATAAGFTTTAVQNTVYLIEVQASDLTADKPYVRLVATEGVDAPVAGSVLIVLSGGVARDPNKQATALT